MSKSAVLGIIFLVEFGQLGLVAIQATRAYFNIIKLIVHIYRLLHSFRYNTFPDRDKQ